MTILVGFFFSQQVALPDNCIDWLMSVSGRVTRQLHFLVLQTKQLILLTISVYQYQSGGAGEGFVVKSSPLLWRTLSAFPAPILKQPSVTLILEVLVPSSDILRHYMHSIYTVFVYTFKQTYIEANTHMQNKNK